MKFFRKIASAAASIAMVGATVGMVAAANFPAPFVDGSTANVAIAYGNNLDLAAVTDIQTALSSSLTSSGGTAAGASSEAYGVFTSSSPLLLNASINSVRTSVTESNLPSVLGDGDFSGNVDADMTYKITLGTNPRTVFGKIPTTSYDPQVGISMSTTSANYLYNATITFDKTVNLTHADSEGEEINFFGQKFLIGTATTGTSLVLFKSAQTIFLSDGGTNPNPSQVVDIGGATYTVDLVAASDTTATIRVTDSSGESSQKEISEGASKKILGVEFSVKTSDESSATNIIQAEIIAGAEKYTLTAGSEVTKGADETAVDGTNVYFGGNIAALTSITVQAFAPDGSADAILPGDEFIDPVFGSFRLLFAGLGVETEDRETIDLGVSGNDKMSIGFKNWQNQEITSFEWVNNESGGQADSFLGNSDGWRIIVREMDQINESAFAIIGNEDEGYLAELVTLSNVTTGYSDDVVKFRNVFDTSETWSDNINQEGSGTINIGGPEYTLTYVDDKTGNGAEHVRLNWPESTGGQMILYPSIETSKGANLAFYEPVTFMLDNWDGAGTDLSAILFPDGDGYTTSDTFATVDGFNWTIGSSTLVTNATGNSVTVTVGRLTYNVTSTGTANQTTIFLTDVSGGNIVDPALVLFEEKDEANVYEAVIVKTGGAGTTDNGIGVSDVDFTWNSDTDMTGTAYGTSGLQQEADDDVYEMMDVWGTKVSTDQSTSDQYTATISYPDQQVQAMLYVDSLVEGSGGTTTLGNVKVMDTELASTGMDQKNLIVVGGSCVNSAASTLLGGAGCGSSWTAATGAGSGEWIIQTFTNPWASSKVATLVAGWEQGDTQNAATYLTTQTVSTDVGTKLKGTTSSTATVVTA